jgi:membrane protein implicated in regulation of membrane protease activity
MESHPITTGTVSPNFPVFLIGNLEARMTILVFVTAMLISGIIYLFGQYSLMVSLFIKATWLIFLVASGFILYLLYRRFRKRRSRLPRLPAQPGD